MACQQQFSFIIIIITTGIIICGLVQESAARRFAASVQCPRNIQRPANSYMFIQGTRIRFRCRGGYTMNGPAYIYCRGNATEWTAPPPTCDARPRCPQLELPENMEMYNNPPHLAIFTCTRGIILGEDTLRCVNGVWSDDVPTCYIEPQRVCQDPGEPANGYKFGGNYRENAFVTFGCYSGYRLVGQSRIRCYQRNDEFVWTGTRPRCRRIDPLKELADRLTNVVETFSMHTLSSNVSRGRLAAHQPNGLDVVLLYDISSSIAPTDFKRGVNFTIFLLERFGVANSQNATRVAAVTFGNEANILFDFERYDNLDDVIDALNDIEANGGGTAMYRALMKVRMTLAKKMRPQAKRVLFLLSDGHSTDPEPLEGTARRLRDEYKMEMFAIGIGNDVQEEEMRNIASRPFATHILSFQNFQQLQRVLEIVLETKPEYERCGLAGDYETTGSRDQGHEINNGAWPWLVNIYDMSRLDTYDPVCGGALICNNWILTTASCLEKMQDGSRVQLLPTDVTVTMGKYDLFANEVSEQKSDVAERIVRHPHYDPETLANNLALIELPANVSLNNRVRTVCVPQENSIQVMTGTAGLGGSGWFAGWGSTGNPATQVFSVAKQMQLLIQGRQQCQNLKPPGIQLGPDMFCAGERQNTYDACRGDLGGPLVVRQENHYFSVVGLSMHNAVCDHYMKTGVFTSVLPHVRWIHNVTKDCNTAANCEMDC